MKIILTALLCISTTLVFAQTDTTQQIERNRQNSKLQQQKPYVILISADGFRYDYAKKYNAKHLLALSEGGVSAAGMIPSYPSLTFPNHYTLVTGLYPAHHGLVSNAFYDPKKGRGYYYKGKAVTEAEWYGGTPLWTLAEQQQMLSASFYWVGSEAPEQGLFPTYYYHYNEDIGIRNRIKTVQNWLSLPEDKRPHLITFYLPEVDHAGHKYGPDAPETAKAVQFIDMAVYELTQAVKQTGLDVNFIFVSDHGMTALTPNNTIPMPRVIDTADFVISYESLLVNIYAKKGHEKLINAAYQQLLEGANNYSVYLKSNVPANLHYSTADDTYGHIGDIVMIPNYPNMFKSSNRVPDPGFHGYDPNTVKDMQATFFAWGPNFKKNISIPAFENINVFPVVTKILGLTYTDKIDGTSDIADKIVSPPAP